MNSSRTQLILFMDAYARYASWYLFIHSFVHSVTFFLISVLVLVLILVLDMLMIFSSFTYLPTFMDRSIDIPNHKCTLALALHSPPSSKTNGLFIDKISSPRGLLVGKHPPPPGPFCSPLLCCGGILCCWLLILFLILFCSVLFCFVCRLYVGCIEKGCWVRVCWLSCLT